MVRGIILPGSSQTTRPVLGPARPQGAEALANIQAKSGNDVKEAGIKQKLICAQILDIFFTIGLTSLLHTTLTVKHCHLQSLTCSSHTFREGVRERKRKRSHTENPLAAGSKLQIVWGEKGMQWWLSETGNNDCYYGFHFLRGAAATKWKWKKMDIRTCIFAALWNSFIHTF